MEPINAGKDSKKNVDDNTLNQKMLSDVNTKLGFHVYNPKNFKHESIKEVVIVEPNMRITSEIMTQAEYCEVIGNRAKHIENSKNFLVFTDVGEETDPVKMAVKEIKDKKCPLSIVRMYDASMGEIWEVNEMVIPFVN